MGKNVLVEIKLDCNGKIDKSQDDEGVFLSFSQGDTVTWICMGAKYRVKVRKLCNDKVTCTHPDTPFAEPIQYPSGDSAPARTALLAPPVKLEAVGHMYKCTYEVWVRPDHWDSWDPHIHVGP